MFKAARNRLVEKKMLTKSEAPSYFIECLLYNVPDGLLNADPLGFPSWLPASTREKGILRESKTEVR